MQTKNKISLSRKTLYVIMLLGVFLSAFGAGNLSIVSAQTAVTNNPTSDATGTPTVFTSDLSKKLLEDTFWLGYNNGRWVLPLDQKPSVTLIDQLDNFGIIWVGFLDVPTDQLLQIPATPVPAIFDGNTWSLAYPGETTYKDILMQMPETLIPASVISEYISFDVTAQSAQNAGYFPWRGSMQVTQDRQNSTNCASYSHCIGGSDEWAWDFANGTSGWPVYASRGGRIAWITTSWATNSGSLSQTWYNVNVIVIDLGDGYAAIYMHLAQDLPVRFNINDTVSTGQLIGYADQTGRSTGSHLHFAIQPWNSSWNGNSSPSIWYRHSQESLFNDESSHGNPGNPTYPNWYTSNVPNPGGGGSSCNPTADQIVLYVDSNFGGICVIKGVGNYVDPGAMGIANDSVSSVKVGGNVKLTLYGDSNYGSTSETFTGDDANLADNSIGDNQASSAKVESRNSSNCSPSADQVALYVDSNYGGICVVKGIGDYPNPGSLGIANDSVSSIKVGGNVKLTICRDDNYSGTCDSFTGDDSNLSDNGIGDNQVSSAKVESRPTGGSCTNGATSAALQPGYDFCANEGGTCAFSGQASVAYGANNCFFYQTFTSSVSCSNSTFGDPISGTSKTCAFKILTSAPSANFDAWPQSGTAPFTSAMHIVDTSNITSCSWNYGDGQTGTSCASLHDHIYNTAGTFTVSLTVSGPGGSDSMTLPNYISVTASGDSYEPDDSSGTASWISSGSTQHSIIPATDADWVIFQLDSPSAITLETTGPAGYDTRMWLYDYNLSQIEYNDDKADNLYSLIDRQCGVDALPAGTYYARIDDYGNNSEIPSYSLSFNITQNCTPPSANFDAWPQSGNAPFVSTMHIVDTSNITSCSWNYGDGQTGTSCASTHDHTYNNAGVYTVSLTVSGPGGSDSMTLTNYITVSGIPNAPSNFTVTGTTSTSIALTWQDNSNNETGFNIYRWDDIGGVWEFYLYAQVGANVPSYTNTQLSCSTDYYYQVSAYNAQYESDRAGWITGTTADCPQADLSITNISISPASPFTNDDVFLNVEVSNLSNIDAPAHWVDFYIDDTPTGCSDWGNYYGRSNGILANSVEIWKVRLQANSLTPGTHQLRAYTDSGCEVIENNESNNISNVASFTFTVPSSAAPAHDDFNSARLVSPIPYSNTVDVSGATTAVDDPYVPDCGGYGLTPGMTSVWYKYTPSVATNLYLDTFGSSYDTYIAVWSGTRGNLSFMSCNDDLSGHDTQSGMAVSLSGGTTYYFEVANYSDSISIASLSVMTADSGLRSSNIGTFVTESVPYIKPAVDLAAQAGGTLQFHVVTVTNPNQTLTVSKSGTGNGTVVSSPSGIDCGSICSYDFVYSSVVTLTATPTSPSTFGGWSGGGCSGLGTCIVTISSAQSVTATFNSPGKLTPTVTASGGPFTYNGAPQGATIIGSVAGIVSNVKYNGSAIIPTTAGTYAVTANFVPTDTTNYNSLTNVDTGSITINKVVLTVTANNQTTHVGSSVPIFTFGYSGFVNSETTSVLTTAPTCVVPGLHAVVGAYDILCSGGAATNYTFSYVKGTLTVTAVNNVPIFADVPFSYWANSYIERLYNAGITGGCGTGIYCPDNTVTRAQMAVFLLKGMHGSSFTPPAVGTSTGFTDVGTDYWAAAWIKQLAAEGITGGCGAGIYCPDSSVTRAQMAVFLLKAKHGSSYSPPNATGVFTDVPVGYWADKWIEQLAIEGVTSGCGTGIYCPDADVTRAQMAVFLVKAFNLP